MPWDRRNYPADWEAITARIRERAGNRCEWPGCGAPNRAYICRRVGEPEDWHETEEETCSDWCLDETYWRPVLVILTVAHLNHEPMDCREENLRAWCQLHHLRYDAQHHAASAAATRRRQRVERGQQELFG